jgi:hypothetical protein
VVVCALEAIWQFIVSTSSAALLSIGYATLADVFAEMKYIIAALYSNYSTSIIDDTGIGQVDSYTAPPENDRLMIRLEKL